MSLSVAEARPSVKLLKRLRRINTFSDFTLPEKIAELQRLETSRTEKKQTQHWLSSPSSALVPYSYLTDSRALYLLQMEP